MAISTQEQFEQYLRGIADYLIKNDPGLTGQIEPEVVSCDFEARRAVIRYRKKDWQKNHRGEVHGGAAATMFDVSMGMTCSAFAAGENVTTTDMSISYIRPFFGDSFDFEVELLHLGKNLIRVRAIARDTETGKEMASATANYAHMKTYEPII